MRVIAGKFKGHSLKGKSQLSIRPTTDRVKEALFNILADKVTGSSFADLFSGYGNVGIEAMSRGANYVAFIDNNKRCIDALKVNISSLISGSCDYKNVDHDIFYQDALNFFLISSKKGYKFDIIFMDPPYKTDLIEKCLFKIHRYDILKNSGIVIAETLTKGVIIPDKVGKFNKFREDFYGNTKLLFFK